MGLGNKLPVSVKKKKREEEKKNISTDSKIPRTLGRKHLTSASV